MLHKYTGKYNILLCLLLNLESHFCNVGISIYFENIDRIFYFYNTIWYLNSFIVLDRSTVYPILDLQYFWSKYSKSSSILSSILPLLTKLMCNHVRPSLIQCCCVLVAKVVFIILLFPYLQGYFRKPGLSYFLIYQIENFLKDQENTLYYFAIVQLLLPILEQIIIQS